MRVTYSSQRTVMAFLCFLIRPSASRRLRDAGIVRKRDVFIPIAPIRGKGTVKPFDPLCEKDKHQLRALADHRPSLGAPFVRLLDEKIGGHAGIDVLSFAEAIASVPFFFHQTGALFRKDGRVYRIPRKDQHSQARKAGIDYGIQPF